MSRVWVEMELETYPIRIFKTQREAIQSGKNIQRMDRVYAVSFIREQIWKRTEGSCEWCANVISYESMHMHEVIPRGKGGEISLENSVGICAECHIGPNGAHGDRAPRFGEKQ